METTIDRFGRVVIPKAVRNELGLAPGTPLHIETTAEGISLRAISEGRVVRKGKTLVYRGPVAAGGLADAVDADREERIHKLMGPAAQ
jgi:AbrB family looped-hinge helix DNA binding protein